MRRDKDSVQCACNGLTAVACQPRGPSHAAPSSNGKTTDSDSVYRGSNPRGASILHTKIKALRSHHLACGADIGCGDTPDPLADFCAGMSPSTLAAVVRRWYRARHRRGNAYSSSGRGYLKVERMRLQSVKTLVENTGKNQRGKVRLADVEQSLQVVTDMMGKIGRQQGPSPQFPGWTCV